MSPSDYPSASYRTASRRLTRAVALLYRAGKQLEAASRISPDGYNRQRLLSLALGLRDVSTPLSRIAGRFEKGGEI